jgi:hypothetical protein
VALPKSLAPRSMALNVIVLMDEKFFSLEE